MAMHQHCRSECARETTPTSNYCYPPIRFGHDVKIVHFIGPIKPWQHRYLSEVDTVILHPGTYASQNAAQDYIKRWWQVFTAAQKVSVVKGEVYLKWNNLQPERIRREGISTLSM